MPKAICLRHFFGFAGARFHIAPDLQVSRLRSKGSVCYFNKTRKMYGEQIPICIDFYVEWFIILIYLLRLYMENQHVKIHRTRCK